jgi:REP element-mobilizing transposase RayT
MSHNYTNEDHVHLALSFPPTITVSKIAQSLKGNPSKWMHETFELLREGAFPNCGCGNPVKIGV